MKAALLIAPKKPLEIHELSLFIPELCFGQVLVKVLLSGICGAQLQEIEGRKGSHFPRLMGHEGCVRVINVGPGVSTVKTGDKCVAHWRKGSGMEGETPRYNFGTEVITGGQVTTFATHAIISENRLTAVPESTPDELCALLGCGLSTALGTMEYEARLLMGETVLIVGCGGLGMNLILAAKLRGASKIAVVDVNETKRATALSMGATDFSTGIGSIDWQNSFDVVIDTTGCSPVIECGIRRVAPSGRFIMIGQPHDGVLLAGPIHLFEGEGKTIIATQGGRFEPHRDIPRYIHAYDADCLPFAGIVTHTFMLDEINIAIDLVRRGGAGRVVLLP